MTPRSNCTTSLARKRIAYAELGAEDYLPKPFDATLLRARVGASLEKKALRDEVRDWDKKNDVGQR